MEAALALPPAASQLTVFRLGVNYSSSSRSSSVGGHEGGEEMVAKVRAAPHFLIHMNHEPTEAYEDLKQATDFSWISAPNLCPHRRAPQTSHVRVQN